MGNHNFNLKLPAVLLVAFALAAQPAVVLAEESIEEIVVVAKSIKASTQSAIDAKRMADNVADVISADAVGRFPDQNLADALGRVPGISIERDQGQARYVSFRGSPKRYTTTAFNGVDVPGVENGRIPRFDAYPSVICFSNCCEQSDHSGHAWRIYFQGISMLKHLLRVMSMDWLFLWSLESESKTWAMGGHV